MERQTVAIIGVGDVGATAALSLILLKLPIDILLVDIDKKRCQGQVLDLQDALAFTNNSAALYQASLTDVRNADIIVIAAGARQKPNQKRTELLTINCNIISSLFDKIGSIKQETVVIMVTNPVDALALHAMRHAGLSAQQIIATGTYLDTKRLTGMLSNKLAIAESSINLYIVGEHGDKQVPVWSHATIAEKPILSFCTSDEQVAFADLVRNRAYEIIECKGATYFGIGVCIADLCKSILYDQKIAVPASCYHQQDELFYSMPVILGKKGVEQIIYIDLSAQEKEQLLGSIDNLRKNVCG